MAAEFVDDRSLYIAVAQGLVGLLPADVDQLLTELSQGLDWDRLSVDIGAGSTFCGDHPAQQTLSANYQILVPQPIDGSGPGSRAPAACH